MTERCERAFPLRHLLKLALRSPRHLLKFALRSLRLKCVRLDEPDELQRLRRIIDGLASRVAAQSELLARRARKKGG